LGEVTPESWPYRGLSAMPNIGRFLPYTLATVLAEADLD
jgi:hypothetical protein